MATALLAVGVAAGCSTTVPGTVAMTTEPGFSTSTRGSSPSTSPRTSSPRTSSPRTATPGTPSAPPGDAQSVTCGQFIELAPEDQTATLTEVMGVPPEGSPTEEMEMLRISFDALCQFSPADITLGELLAGGPP